MIFGHKENEMTKDKKKFVAYLYINGFDNLSLGFHICLSLPNFEIHIPFGFIRIGWEIDIGCYVYKPRKLLYRSFGLY